MESKINDVELEVLKSCVKEIKTCTGNEFGYTSDIIVHGMSTQQLKGYLSQLFQKKLIFIYTDFDGQFYLTKKGCEIVGENPNKFEIM